MNIVNARLSILVVVTELNCSVPDSDNAVATVGTFQVDYCKFFVRADFEGAIFLLKGNVTWLVIINDSDTSFSVLSLKQLTRECIVQLDEEISVGIPIIVIVDLDFDILLGLSFGEFENLVNRDVILVSLGFTLYCGNANTASLTSLVDDRNSDLLEGFRD